MGQNPAEQTVANGVLLEMLKTTGLQKLDALNLEEQQALDEIDKLRKVILEKYAVARAALMREIGQGAK